MIRSGAGYLDLALVVDVFRATRCCNATLAGLTRDFVLSSLVLRLFAVLQQNAFKMSATSPEKAATLTPLRSNLLIPPSRAVRMAAKEAELARQQTGLIQELYRKSAEKPLWSIQVPVTDVICVADAVEARMMFGHHPFLSLFDCSF